MSFGSIHETTLGIEYLLFYNVMTMLYNDCRRGAFALKHLQAEGIFGKLKEEDYLHG